MPRPLNFPLGKPFVLLVFLMMVGAVAPTRSEAQENDRRFERMLRQSFQASLSGQSLRETLDAVRDSTGVAYWLDRRVDPDQPLPTVTAGPDIEHAYTRVAKAADLDAFPVDGIVVIGRPEWIDPVSIAWLTQLDRPPQKRTAPISVDWPPLTTPADALRLSGFDAAAFDLPHDLWPALQVDAVQPATMLLLIGAQFDQWLEWDEQDGWRARPLPESTSIIRRYPNNGHTASLRDAVLRRDPATKWAAKQQQIVVDADVRVHRWMLQSMRHNDRTASRGGRKSAPKRQRPSTEQATFRFELKNAVAGAALAKLAESAGWELTITPSAHPVCQQRISFEDADDATLEQWVQRVVDKVDLTAVREGDKLLIDTK